MNFAPRSVWRSRVLLFAILGLAILVNLGILVSHSVFYEARLRGLQAERKEVEAKRDEARAAAEKVASSERRLAEQKAQLGRFYGETLGERRQRLAPLIEEIYDITRRAGFLPAQFSFGEDEVPGAHRLEIGFAIEGSYADVKRLLAAFENNPGFLVLEAVSVSLDEKNPDVLKVGLTVAHYFHAEGNATSAAMKRRSREAR